MNVITNLIKIKVWWAGNIVNKHNRFDQDQINSLCLPYNGIEAIVLGLRYALS